MQESENQNEFKAQNLFTKSFCVKNVVTTTLDASLAEVARLMLTENIGDVIVVEEQNGIPQPVGILTDRDLALQSLSQEKGGRRLIVSDILKRSLATAKQSDDIFQLIAVMKENGVGRLPLVDDKNNLVGIVTSKNIMKWLARAIYELSNVSKKEQWQDAPVSH